MPAFGKLNFLLDWYTVDITVVPERKIHQAKFKACHGYLQFCRFCNILFWKASFDGHLQELCICHIHDSGACLYQLLSFQ